MDRWHLDQSRGSLRESNQLDKAPVLQQFSEENLSKLPIDEYINLWRRFAKDAVTHVVRHGIRDHIGHKDHTAGQGEFFDGAKQLFADGRLRSPLGVHLRTGWSKDNVFHAIQSRINLQDQSLTFEKAKKWLDWFTSESIPGESGSYVDAMAIHFAANEVAAGYYVAEQRNQIFVVYPSIFIASQFDHKGYLGEGSKEIENDKWVWANKERGIALDAGIVFVPADAQVDSRTGSRYQLDSNGKAALNQNSLDGFLRLTASPDFSRVIAMVEDILKLPERDRKMHLYTLENVLQPFDLGRQIAAGLIDKEILDKIRKTSRHLSGFDADRRYEFARSTLQRLNALYILASSTISSREYWENYFRENPSLRPRKVIYYSGDPTGALFTWRNVNRINLAASDEDFGFPERHILWNDLRAMVGIDDFHKLGLEVLKDYY